MGGRRAARLAVLAVAPRRSPVRVPSPRASALRSPRALPLASPLRARAATRAAGPATRESHSTRRSSFCKLHMTPWPAARMSTRMHILKQENESAAARARPPRGAFSVFSLYTRALERSRRRPRHAAVKIPPATHAVARGNLHAAEALPKPYEPPLPPETRLGDGGDRLEEHLDDLGLILADVALDGCELRLGRLGEVRRVASRGAHAL